MKLGASSALSPPVIGDLSKDLPSVAKQKLVDFAWYKYGKGGPWTFSDSAEARHQFMKLVEETNKSQYIRILASDVFQAVWYLAKEQERKKRKNW